MLVFRALSTKAESLQTSRLKTSTEPRSELRLTQTFER